MIIEKLWAAAAIGVAGTTLWLGAAGTSYAANVDGVDWRTSPGTSQSTSDGGYTVDGVRIH